MKLKVGVCSKAQTSMWKNSQSWVCEKIHKKKCVKTFTSKNNIVKKFTAKKVCEIIHEVQMYTNVQINTNGQIHTNEQMYIDIQIDTNVQMYNNKQ